MRAEYAALLPDKPGRPLEEDEIRGLHGEYDKRVDDRSAMQTCTVIVPGANTTLWYRYSRVSAHVTYRNLQRSSAVFSHCQRNPSRYSHDNHGEEKVHCMATAPIMLPNVWRALWLFSLRLGLSGAACARGAGQPLSAASDSLLDGQRHSHALTAFSLPVCPHAARHVRALRKAGPSTGLSSGLPTPGAQLH